MSRHQGVVARLRAELVLTPELTTPEAAKRLGVTTTQASSALAYLRHREGATPLRTLPVLVPGHMVRGEGDRKECCARYSACLSAFAAQSNAQARCPEACVHFADGGPPVLDARGASPLATAQDHAVGNFGLWTAGGKGWWRA